MATLDKIGKPKAGGPNTDAGTFLKLAQRVETILKNCINLDEKQLEPQKLLVDPANRDGAPPNVQHVHYGILQSFAKNGYERTRPQTGICVQYKAEAGKLKLLQHNKRFTSGSKELLPVMDDQAIYGTLAGSHLNLALKILKHGVISPAVDVTTMIEPGSSLEEVTKEGHKWWILPEDTPKDDLVDISLWRNQDGRGR